ncbi:BrnA antitoxin family protein [Pelistega suis]|uniref:BrnA antitoxin family protein n=1 Tax=Pelistega suis TaxID=1631957 RepID=UPI00211B9E64|nr:BrnA antitoxin family protein [Pelistega suis]MCQ9329761.1 BrnA antitoxin family protein [Pelistega suis]
MNEKLPNPELVDDENPEWTEKMFQQAIPTSQLPHSLQKKLRGRPKLSSPKQIITIRYDADIIEKFKAMGKGWQTKMNDVLREWLQTQSR